MSPTQPPFQVEQYRQHCLVFYDGNCPMCHWLVGFVIPRQHAAQCWFTPLFGQTMRQLAELNVPFPPMAQPENQTILVLAQGHLYTHSTAVVHLLSTLQAPWRYARIVGWLPTRWRDRMYTWIANKRYVWFDRYPTCPVPDNTMQRRWLP